MCREPVAFERRADQGQLGGVVRGRRVRHVAAREELSRVEEATVDGIVIPMRLDEALDREAALQELVPCEAPEMRQRRLAPSSMTFIRPCPGSLGRRA